MIKRFTGVGISSLLTVILVLCLGVFAILCFSTANAEKKISQSYAKSIEEYFEAQNKAQTILALLREGQLPEGVTFDGETYSYSCRINNDRVLNVCVKISGNRYEIINYQTQNTALWEADDSLELWKGE